MNDEMRGDAPMSADERVDRDEPIAEAAAVRGDDGRASVVVASFNDRSAAEAAVERLRETGYDRGEIGFASRDNEGRTVVVEDDTNSGGPGALGGAVTGAAAGGTLAWLGLTAIPAIGPFLAAGAIGTALIGAGAGAVTGGVLGGLLGLGIPRHRAEYHQEQLERGLSLVTVRTGEPLVAERVLNEAGAVEVDRGDDGTTTAAPAEEMSLDRDR